MTTTTEAPKRVQRRRTKGWRMPPGAIYVGRPSKWGNPWKPKDFPAHPTKENAALGFRFWLNDDAAFAYEYRVERRNFDDLSELRGKDLACWCPLGQPCHADVLLELANTPGRLL